MAEAVQVPGATAFGGRHGHSHAHPANLQHHFDTPAQQFDASKFGMWLFLATEVLFFSGLFCAYAIFRRNHPEIFEAGHQYLNPLLGGLNTVVLILSSFTMALGVWCAQTSRRKGLIVCIALTLAGACAFMVVKYFEYSHKIHLGLNWGRYYDPREHKAEHATTAGAHAAPAAAPTGAQPAAQAAPPAVSTAASPAVVAQSPGTVESGLKIERSQILPAPPGPGGLALPAESTPSTRRTHAENVHIFFSIYYGMTGLHGLHVLGGIVVLTILLINAIRGRYDSNYYTPVDLIGLYWHLVDLVWIYLFPLLYLIE